MRSLVPLLVLPLSAAAAAASTAPWRSEVAPRLRDGARAFHPSGSGRWKAISPESGVSVRIDRHGARLERDGAGLGLRTVDWGRPGVLRRVDADTLQLGACIGGLVDPSGACVQQLELQSDDLTEAWSATDQGMEQSWTMDAPPAGKGELLLEIAVEGGDVAVMDDDLWLDGRDGTAWIASGFAAWDAKGSPLPLKLESTVAGFHVRIDDTHAWYPVTIDPVYTTSATLLTGEAMSDFFGDTVSGAGDVNGDGYDDVIVGAPYYSSSTGRAYVYYGSADGVSNTADVTLTGPVEGDNFGLRVAGVGDVNGDGYDDVVITTDSETTTALAYVYLGSPSGLTTSPDASLIGRGSAPNEPLFVSYVGDVNGDGYDDVVVGAPFYGEDGGALIYMGSATGVSTTPATILEDGGAHHYDYGTLVSGAGDVNGDGYDDVMVGNPAAVDETVGRIYIYHGSASGVSTSPATVLERDTPDGFGIYGSGAGDVNGDGYDDVIAGSPGDDSVYVYYGSADGVVSTAATVLTGGTDEREGYAVAGMGDVNGDGFDDIVAEGKDLTSDIGQVYIYHGSASGVSTSPDTTLTGETDSFDFGTSLAGAGDVDGDGYADLIVGAPYYKTTGGAYVYSGRVLTEGPSDTGDSGGDDSGDTGDTGDSTAPDTDASDSDTRSGDSETASLPADTDTGSPSKTSPGCGCATADPNQGLPGLLLLPLLILRRRLRSRRKAPPL